MRTPAMRTFEMVLGASLLALAGAAVAQEPPEAATAPSAFPGGWYATPMATWFNPDAGRCGVQDGLGGTLALGNRGEFAALELWGQFLSVDHDGCDYTVPDSGNPPANPDGDLDDDPDPVTEAAGALKLNGGGLTLVAGPFFDEPVLARFFGLVGFGVLQRQGHPQYDDDDTTIFADAGLGYLHPFTLFGVPTALRAEARYRYDVQQPPHPDQQDPAPPHAYSDILVNVGLQFALFHAEPAPAPAPEPVSVVPAEAAQPAPEPAPEPAPVVAPAAEAETDAEPTLETAKAGDTIVLHGVNFETARATLTTNARTLLDDVAAKLAARPGLKVEIGGHTDARGADAYNQDLSERRAQAVLDYLVAKGVDAASLTSVGYGEAQPTADNESDEGRERNRRVELKILEQGNTDASS